MNEPQIQKILLVGNALERGKIHGELLKALIWETMERFEYLALLEDPSLNPDDFIDYFLDNTQYLQVAKQLAPDLLEEVRGISIGSGLDFKRVFFYQCLDEVGRFAETLKKSNIFSGNCTGVGCNKTLSQPAFLGQNLDTLSQFRGLEALFHIYNPNHPIEALVLSRPGVLGIFGMNNIPLGVTVNTIHCNYRWDGLPLVFIVRALLTQPDLPAAVRFLKTIPFGVGQNYMVGDCEKILSFECSANQCVQFIPENSYTRIYHTNHPIVNTDLIPNYPEKGTSSKDRFKYLEFRLKDPTKPITLANLKHMLSSHYGPICFHGDNSPKGFNTWISALYVLKKNPELHVARGNPCIHGYEKFTFDRS